MLAFMLANDRGLMPAKHVINALPCIPVIKLASLYFHYCFLATKQGRTFRNANNLYSSCRQTFVKSPAEMNEWISAPTMSDLNTKSLFSLHGESIIHVIILSKNHFCFFFLDRFFLEYTILFHPKM